MTTSWKLKVLSLPALLRDKHQNWVDSYWSKDGVNRKKKKKKQGL